VLVHVVYISVPVTWSMCVNLPCGSSSSHTQLLDSAGASSLGVDTEFQVHIEHLQAMAAAAENLKDHLTHYMSVLGGTQGPT
jgi:hypothetical protein